MHVTFYRSDKERCADFASHFMAGVRANGDTVEELSINRDIADKQDVAVVLGVKKKRLFQVLHDRGTPMVYIDKGYTREWTHRRISIGDCQPNTYLGSWGKPADRRKAFNWWAKDWKSGTHILLAWSSPGYHLHMGLPSPEEYAEQIVAEIRQYTDRPIIYRPKPNQQRIAVPGTELSAEGHSILLDLVDCHCLVTVSSSVCLQAVMCGVPSIVLGDAIGLPISSSLIECINKPYRASKEQCNQWLNDLAYSQWSLNEYAKGEAWAHVRSSLFEERFEWPWMLNKAVAL